MNYSLPLLLQGLEFALSPMAEDAEQHTRQWLRGLGLEVTPKATHQLDIYLPGKYAGFMWPDADREDLYVLSDLTGWFSCQDDLADEDLSRAPDVLESVLRKVQRIARDSAPSNCEGLGGGFKDILDRAARSMPALWRERTLEQYASYLYPCLHAAHHRMAGTQPTAEDYESVWRNAGGFQVCFEFTYFVCRVNLPSTVYYSAVWQTLRRLSLNLMKAVNDLLSFAIMENPDEDVYNLLTHLRHHQSLSPDQATEEVRQRIEQWVHQFHDVQARLPEELTRLGCDDELCEQVQRCADALRVQWLGNIGWHLAVPRYREIRFRPDG
ncbi:terpene synthase family protein [Pseudomonas sp. BW7P1]|uniref:terpene synthase family protein n=1 Tax=Pseudomonas TaxID=286 RepID=UPI0021ADB14B|nr:hypothetical protein [Pseudomonas sp. BW7P1]UWI59643.1 hypothetical protein NWV16_16165 [Pseudomonas sp. BW7P1]